MTRARRPLAEAAADPTFQPRRSDVAALVGLLADADEAIADACESALLRVGPPAIPIALARLDDATPPLRGRLVRVLGRFAREAPELSATIVGLLGDDDPKARRNAIIAAGKLDDPTVSAALLERAAIEGSLPHLRSLAAALGKVGGADGLAWLEALDDRGDPELARIRAQALLIAGRSQTRGAAASTIVGERPSPRPLTVQLTARRGLEALLVDEWAALGLGRALFAEPGVVELRG
ncbi:MAG: HEAT repeat domain-containing protein, partial [Nannocystaceae bacterium]